MIYHQGEGPRGIQLVGRCVDCDSESDFDLDEHVHDRADCEDALMNMMTVYHQEGSRFQGP